MKQRPIPTRVLVVDDEKAARRLVHWQLGDGSANDGHDWTVMEADCPEAACALLDQYEFDCIVLDLGMAQGTPQEVFRTVRCCAGDTPILVMSNYYDSDEIYEYCRTHGAAGFLPKLGVQGSELRIEICHAMEWEATELIGRDLIARHEEHRVVA